LGFRIKLPLNRIEPLRVTKDPKLTITGANSNLSKSETYSSFPKIQFPVNFIQFPRGDTMVPTIPSFPAKHDAAARGQKNVPERPVEFSESHNAAGAKAHARERGHEG
jgi:hypothetical protein